LCEASKHSHRAIVDLLLHHNADVNFKDGNGQTALDLASNPDVKLVLKVTATSCGAVWCSVVQCDVLKLVLKVTATSCGAVWCSVLQCVAVCCRVLQCAAVCCSIVRDTCYTCCVAAMCEMVVGVRRSDTRRKEEMPQLELLVTQDA